MQNACIFPKCNQFHIAIERFCVNQYPSFIYTKTQTCIFPIVGIRFFFFFCTIQELRTPTICVLFYRHSAMKIQDPKVPDRIVVLFVCLFVFLELNGPVNAIYVIEPVNLHNQTFPGQRLTNTVHILSPRTDNCPS